MRMSRTLWKNTSTKWFAVANLIYPRHSVTSLPTGSPHIKSTFAQTSPVHGVCNVRLQLGSAIFGRQAATSSYLQCNFRYGGSDGTRTAASCVTGRCSNQLNY